MMILVEILVFIIFVAVNGMNLYNPKKLDRKSL